MHLQKNASVFIRKIKYECLITYNETYYFTLEYLCQWFYDVLENTLTKHCRPL